MDSNGGLSNSDVALLADRADGFGGSGAFFWIFALLILAGGGGFGWGNNRNGVTESELTAGLNNSQIQSQLNSLAVETANNNYETAQLINAQTNAMLQQNNTNLINAIQGFNSVSQQIASLSAQMNSCCCEIKTQMLQDRLADKESENVALQNAISNANQSQYILSQLGRFVAWNPSGSQASVAG